MGCHPQMEVNLEIFSWPIIMLHANDAKLLENGYVFAKVKEISQCKSGGQKYTEPRFRFSQGWRNALRIICHACPSSRLNFRIDAHLFSYILAWII